MPYWCAESIGKAWNEFGLQFHSLKTRKSRYLIFKMLFLSSPLGNVRSALWTFSRSWGRFGLELRAGKLAYYRFFQTISKPNDEIKQIVPNLLLSLALSFSNRTAFSMFCDSKIRVWHWGWESMLVILFISMPILLWYLEWKMEGFNIEMVYQILSATCKYFLSLNSDSCSESVLFLVGCSCFAALLWVESFLKHLSLWLCRVMF